MVHICRNCKRTFSTQLELDLHQDSCVEDQLFCTQCGERFPERRATRDGWNYECPTEGCEGTGLGEDLRSVTETISVSR